MPVYSRLLIQLLGFWVSLLFNRGVEKFAILVSVTLLAGFCSATTSTTTSAKSSHHSTTSAKHKKSTKSAQSGKSGKSGKSKNTASKHGQKKIDPQRAHAIQEALIREHYLTGEPTGTWDDASEKAMQKFQADNGWQDKTTPDSRALIKLGLGPDHDHLLNPETAMTTPHAQAITPASPPAAGATASKTPQ